MSESGSLGFATLADGRECRHDSELCAFAWYVLPVKWSSCRVATRGEDNFGDPPPGCAGRLQMGHAGRGCDDARAFSLGNEAQGLGTIGRVGGAAHGGSG